MFPMALGGVQIDPLQAFAQMAQGGQQPQAQVADPLVRALEYAKQQQAQMGPAPQADPSIMADMERGQRERQMAEALMGQGYVQDSGALGALAQVFSAYAGKKKDAKAGETIADALAREMEMQQQAAQYEGQRKAFDEGPRKIMERIQQAQAFGLEGKAAEQYALTGNLPKESAPRGFQMSGGFLLNKDTGEVEQVQGYEDSRRRIAAAGAASGGGGSQPKPPSGYRWNEDGSLAPIPGGPADKPQPGSRAATLPAETRMKLGMLQAAREAAKKYEQAVLPEGGGFERQNLWVGPAGGQIEEAINNILRVESGAAVPESEVAGGVRRYGASTLNREDTARANLQQLYDKIDILERNIIGAEPLAEPEAPQAQPAPIQAGQDMGNGIRIRSVRPAGQ